LTSLKDLFNLIHRDWIVGHGSNALSDKDKAERILLQSGGGQLAGICNPLRGVSFPEFTSGAKHSGEVNFPEFL
jgi:hypothetical protein